MRLVFHFAFIVIAISNILFYWISMENRKPNIETSKCKGVFVNTSRFMYSVFFGIL